MTEQEAVIALEQHAEWMRGGNDALMLTPKGLIEAIDAIVKTTKQHPIGTCPVNREVLLMIPNGGKGPRMCWIQGWMRKDGNFFAITEEESEGALYLPKAWRDLPGVQDIEAVNHSKTNSMGAK